MNDLYNELKHVTTIDIRKFKIDQVLQPFERWRDVYRFFNAVIPNIKIQLAKSVFSSYQTRPRRKFQLGNSRGTRINQLSRFFFARNEENDEEKRVRGGGEEGKGGEGETVTGASNREKRAEGKNDL